MQTYTIKDQHSDLAMLIKNKINEPIIIKNNAGNNFLLMPFTDKQDIFLMLSKSFNALNKQDFQKPVEPKMTAKEFIEKWAGILKDTDIKDWKDDRYNYLMEKYK